MQEKYEKFLKKITLIFLLFFPLTGLTFFYHNLTTLFIVIFILFLFISILLINKEALKKSKYIFLFYLLCFLYLALSYFQSKYFVSLIPNNYSLYKEFLTILKLMMPLTFLYSLYFLKLSSKEYMIVVKSWTITYFLALLIPNLFLVSLSSYGSGRIAYNILAWQKNLPVELTASKGFFVFANQIAVILLSLLIILSKEVLQRKRNIFYIFFLSISMLLLGTRVSSLGGLLTLFCLIIFYFILVLFKKEKFNKNIFLLIFPFIMWLLILPISPFMSRNKDLKEYKPYVGEEILESEDNGNEVIDSREEYVLQNYNPNYLPPVFFYDYYSIKYDSFFWYEFIRNTPISKMNYRYIEKSIIQRMIEINNHKSSILLGISNSRIQEVVNLERDFLLHYYAFGIVGCLILLSIYLILVFKSMALFFKNPNYSTFNLATVIILFIFSAYLTGNIINSLFPVISFIFLISPLNCKKVA